MTDQLLPPSSPERETPPALTPKLPRHFIDADEGYEMIPNDGGTVVMWDDLAAYFTQEDVAWLRRMEFMTFDPARAEAHQAWFQSFLVRIDALLPPPTDTP